MTSAENKILMKIPPRIVSVGGPSVHRLLPFAKKRMVGPFIFFDYFPATDFAAGEGINVRPHPHIGLSTLSYLLEGSVLHHDSLGKRQILSPGDVNWMTAGKGISHSERLPSELQGKAHRLHLLQFWVALPLAFEETVPTFHHFSKNEIPCFQEGKAKVTLIAGSALGQKSPVQVFSPLFFMDIELEKNQNFTLAPGPSQELAFFILKGSLSLSSEEAFSQGDFVVLELGSSLQIKATENLQVILLGGEPFPEPRHIYWNFVSSSQEKIEQAKLAWQQGTFPQVPDEPDVIPLPEEKP